ncbi:MAG: divalent-cation tolerance protein CutA [Promethearchaeota archaeon]
MDHSDSMIFYVTTPDKKTALKLASDMVNNKIAACANIIESVSSVYRWKGEVHKEQECMMVIKTTKMKSDNLIKFIQKNHPYEVAECIGINIAKGSEPYLKWIVDSTSEG